MNSKFRRALLALPLLTAGIGLGTGQAMAAGGAFAVALVSGRTADSALRVLSKGDTMAASIVHHFPEATGLHSAALIGVGGVLFAITSVVNMVARVVANQTSAMSGVGQ